LICKIWSMSSSLKYNRSLWSFHVPSVFRKSETHRYLHRPCAELGYRFDSLGIQDHAIP
jgi:hypothetical protein